MSNQFDYRSPIQDTLQVTCGQFYKKKLRFCKKKKHFLYSWTRGCPFFCIQNEWLENVLSKLVLENVESQHFCLLVTRKEEEKAYIFKAE